MRNEQSRGPRPGHAAYISAGATSLEPLSVRDRGFYRWCGGRTENWSKAPDLLGRVDMRV